MKAIKNLKIFRENINRNQFEPTEDIIDKLGEELAEAACTFEGYEKLVWQAGEDLLVASELVGRGADKFYDRFGYTTVANALRTSIEDGNFPMGLGFISHNFLPSGGLEVLSHHPHIRQTLQILRNTKVTISPQSFLSTPHSINITSQFLAHARVLDIPIDISLQIAAILLMIAANEQDRELATRAVLDQLVSNEKAISLFYCWRAACEKYPALWSESAYMESLFTLLKVCRTLPDQGVVILSQLHADQALLSAVAGNTRLFYMIALSGWWLYVGYRYTEGRDNAFQLIWNIMSTYPELHKALKSYLENENLTEQLPEEIEQIQKDSQKEMRILREELRLRVYRGVPLTLQIQRHNLVNIFEPLYEALEDSSALPGSVHTRIHELDTSTLVDENPVQKAAPRHLQIMGDLRSNMIKDYETIITSTRRALELREKLSASTTEAVSTLPLETPEIQREVTAIVGDDPELRWLFEWFVPEIVRSMQHV